MRRVDRLDISLFEAIREGGTSWDDCRSLLALHAALAARGSFEYLEIGSYFGRSLQAVIADPRCRRIISIDRRDAESPDERSDAAVYPDNSTAQMIEALSNVPGADLSKLRTFDETTANVDPSQIHADFCFIDAEHTNTAAIADARFCRQVLSDRGVIVFHDRTLVDGGIRQFLREVPNCRVYPLAHELLVVELNVPTLLDDSRVRSQLPHTAWRLSDRVRATRLVLRFGGGLRWAAETLGRAGLMLGAPRRANRSRPPVAEARSVEFEVHTFVNDEDLYHRMRASFLKAGFDEGSFVQLTDSAAEPFSLITHLGRESSAKYLILCHQDVCLDRGAGRAELEAALANLDARDPRWVVAGVAGVMRSGRLTRRVVDATRGLTPEQMPLPVVCLDECFLVLNARRQPRCSDELSGFHLYGTDVCLHALAAGGSAYVIDMPMTHGGTNLAEDHARATSRGYGAGASRGYWQSYEDARARFVEVWRGRVWFSYLITPILDTIFLSRSRLLRRIFGSRWAVSCVARCAVMPNVTALRPVDRLLSRQLWVRRP